MAFLQSRQGPRLKLQLTRDLTRTLKRGHPWVYGDALRDRPTAPPGTQARLFDKRGRAEIARGFYDPNSPIAFRVCTLDPNQSLSDGWVRHRLEKALAWRRTLFDEQTTGFRLCHGEGDGLPGLVCDLYGDFAVIQLDGDGPAGFYNAPGIAVWLRETLSLQAVALQQRSRPGEWLMRIKKIATRWLSRRQFMQMSATATAGLLLAACSTDPPVEEPAVAEPEVAAQVAPTDTPTTAPAPPAEPAPTDTPSVAADSNPAPAEPATATPSPTAASESTLTTDMTQAAIRLLEALNADQRNKASYAFVSDERFRWHWTTPSGFPRNGLPLREMTDAQKGLAYDLLQASLSGIGFEKSINIISLQVDLGNDPELYYITFFGTPGSDEPWGWRWEGHHLSRHFAVIRDQVVMLPFFLGSWPTTSRQGLRAMAVEEDAALELINSLTGDARQMAIFQDRTLTRHETQNAARVDPLAPVGILYSDLAANQQALINNIVQAYLNTMPESIADPSLTRINDAGWDQTRFGWAGSLDHQRPQYYRIQGPTFLLEYDNSRNGGTHIHSVWRDFEQDFGYHLLA